MKSSMKPGRQGEGGAPAGQGTVIPVWLVWLAGFALVFGALGSFGILDNNEGLYAEIPREMLAAGDWRHWVIPHLNGLPYMEKPPLLYWLTALSFSLFGQAEWAARLVPALSALSCVGLLLWFGRVSGHPRAGRLAALMFISGTGVIAMSHVLMFDMLLTALLSGALGAAWRFYGSGRLAALRWAYVLLALAVLAKGLVAVALFGMVLLLFLLLDSGSVRGFLAACRRWFDPLAVLLFFAVAAPWHIAASAVEPIFAWFYFINEHVLRFLGRRQPHDYYAGPWWYYLPRMAIYLFPWSFLLPALLRRVPRAVGADRSLDRFLACAWIAPLVFFSVSSAKANYYLVVVMPFAAFHLALALERRNFLGARGRALPGILIVVLAAVLCIVLAGRPEPGHGLTVMGLTENRFLFALFAGCGVLGAAAAAWAAFAPRVGLLAYLLLPAWIAAGMTAALHGLEPTISTREAAAFLDRELPGRQVYLYRNFEEQSSLPFYLKHPVPVVDAHSNDLYWGNRLQPNRILISDEQFRGDAAAAPVAIVVMRRQLEAFRAAGLAALFPHRRKIGDSTIFYN